MSRATANSLGLSKLASSAPEAERRIQGPIGGEAFSLLALTAGERQGAPERVLAPQRGLASMGAVFRL